MKESYNSLKAPEAVGHYPHAKQVGEFVFLSGVGPRKRGSKELVYMRSSQRNCHPLPPTSTTWL